MFLGDINSGDEAKQLHVMEHLGELKDQRILRRAEYDPDNPIGAGLGDRRRLSGAAARCQGIRFCASWQPEDMTPAPGDHCKAQLASGTKRAMEHSSM